MDEEIFREYDIRGIVGEQLDEASVSTIARAIGTYFCHHNAKKIVVGFDARESSPRFGDLLVKGLNQTGCDCILIGRVPTPVLYFATFTKDVEGGVMITASHNPGNHNGFKISLGKNSLHGEEIQKIKKIALAGKFADGQGSNETVEILNDYLDALLSRIKFGERKLKVVVDAGNGMGGVTAIPLYKSLGVEIIELFCEPDGRFPNHEADPSQEKNLRDLIKSVLENRADLGIAFDGDADRMTIIDDRGKIIWGDELLILFAREILRDYPNRAIVTETRCTQTLFDEIKRLGGNSVVSKAGHSIIKAKMRETDSILGGEMSGHIFFADRFFGFDDAAYAGARVLEILSKTEKKLSQIFDEFPRKFSTPEIRVECSEVNKLIVLKKIIEYFSKDYEVMTIDGAKIIFENGWGIVRPSNTQALLTLRFEADTPENLQKIREMVENKVREFL